METQTAAVKQLIH